MAYASSSQLQKLLAINSGQFGNMPEVLAMAGVLCIMVCRSGFNPAKSLLRSIVEKKDHHSNPVQPCGPVSMTDHQ